MHARIRDITLHHVDFAGQRVQFKVAVLVFTALHVMQTRYSEENSVCLSVCLSIRPSVRLSVTRVIPDKTEERSVQIFTVRKNIYPSLLRRRMVGGGRPLLPEILGPSTPVGA